MCIGIVPVVEEAIAFLFPEEAAHGVVGASGAVLQLVVHDGHCHAGGVAADGEAEEGDLQSRNEELKEEEGDVAPHSDEALDEEGGEAVPLDEGAAAPSALRVADRRPVAHGRLLSILRRRDCHNLDIVVVLPLLHLNARSLGGLLLSLFVDVIAQAEVEEDVFEVGHVVPVEQVCG